MQITLLINNAGVVSGRALLDTPDHLIERSFNVNVLAHFWVRYGIYIDFLTMATRQYYIIHMFRQRGSTRSSNENDDLTAFFQHE